MSYSIKIYPSFTNRTDMNIQRDFFYYEIVIYM